jgi:hypothetical protein
MFEKLLKANTAFTADSSDSSNIFDIVAARLTKM